MRRSLIAVAIIAALLAAAACGGGAGEGGVPPEERAAAPGFTVPALEGGGEVSLSDYRGRPLVLNFWASWCGPCREEMPALRDFAAARPGVQVLGLAVSDAPGDSRRFARDLGVDFDLAIDRRGNVAGEYGVTGLPVTVGIDAEGRIVTTWFGPIGRSDLDGLADQLGA